MGAGKTRIALTIASRFKTIILCPKPIIAVFKEEIKKFGIQQHIEISTYESCPTAGDYDCIILDEILKVKNPNTKVHKRVKELATRCQYRLGFLAHPISAPAALDLRYFNILLDNWIEENPYKFIYQYGINPKWEERQVSRSKTIKELIHEGWNWEMLIKYINPFIINIPEEVIESLLPKHVEYIKVVLPKPQHYDKICRGAYADFDFTRVPSQKRTITSGFVYDEKGDSIDLNAIKEDWIAEYIKKSEGTTVIFCAFRREMERLERRLNCPCIRAGRDYEQELKRFRQEYLKAIIVSAQLSEVFNLQTADSIIFMSNSMSPVKKIQAIGRVVRPYNLNTVVRVYELLCEGTEDFKVLERLEGYIAVDKEVLNHVKEGL